MMPVKGPSEGLAPFWEEFEAQYEAGGFWIGDRYFQPMAEDIEIDGAPPRGENSNQINPRFGDNP